jgi:diguanylate cyclase (GGDEF)-like protein/PAS domain S-box-containing protein
MNTLVVTADNLTRAIMSDLLSERGHEVNTCTDVSSAIAITDSATVPLIILDWSVAGAEILCRHLTGETSEDSPGRRSLVLAVTREDNLATPARALAAGASDYISLAMAHQVIVARLAAAERHAEEIVRRMRAEAAPQEIDARFRSLVQNAPDLITILSPDGKIRYESPAVARVLGYPDGSLEGKDAFSFIHPEDNDRTRAAFAEVLADPSNPVSVRFRFRHLDGSWRWLDTISVNAIDEPSVHGIIANSRDVTEQIEAETAVRTSAQRYQQLFVSARRQAQELELLEKVRVALAREMELSVVFHTVVEAIAETLAYTLVSAYLVEGEHLVLQHQTGYDRVIDRIPIDEGISGRVVRTGQPILLKDVKGDPGFLAAMGGLGSEICVPIMDQETVVGTLNVESKEGTALDEDDLRLMIALSENVSVAVARARLFTQARVSDARFRAAFDDAPTGMALVHGDGHFLQVNRALCQLLGRQPDDLLETDLLSLVRSRDQSRIRRRLQQLGDRETTTAQMEILMMHAEGHKVWVDLSISRVNGESESAGYFIIQTQDATERKALLARLEHQAHHDPLTALPNRTCFSEHLERATSEDQEEQENVALLLIDLDGFKLLNDTYGHAIGDGFLVAAAQRLANALRDDDVIARLGGDEFGVLLRDVSTVADAKKAAERLLNALRTPFRVESQDAVLSASIGIAVEQSQLATPAELLQKADIALYRAKHAGRGVCIAFHPSMATPAVAKIDQERHLQRAVTAGDVEVAYQPQISLTTGRIEGVEALARLAHAELGMLLPGDFLKLAEQSGLIVPMGWNILERACQDWQDWSRTSRSPVPILSVNFSAQQLQQSDVSSQIAKILRDTGMNPASLQLEISERSWAVDPKGATNVNDELRELGIRRSIDDFGSEIASLLHILAPQVDGLSLSPSLLNSFRSKRGGVGFIRAFVTLAHDLGLTLTAKAIETVSQLATARSLGIGRGQGYYLAPPMSSSQVAALLADDHHVDLSTPTSLSIVGSTPLGA